MNILYASLSFLDSLHVASQYLPNLFFPIVLIWTLFKIDKDKTNQMAEMNIPADLSTGLITLKASPQLMIFVLCMYGMQNSTKYIGEHKPTVEVIDSNKDRDKQKNETKDTTDLESLLATAKEELKRDKDSIANKTYYKEGLIKGDSDYLEQRIRDLNKMIHQKK